jgi:hypothetical protein
MISGGTNFDKGTHLSAGPHLPLLPYSAPIRNYRYKIQGKKKKKQATMCYTCPRIRIFSTKGNLDTLEANTEQNTIFRHF